MAIACEIDWAALGTWAAVVIALGLALRDKVEARARRKAEAAILAVLIEPELQLMAVRIEKIKEAVGLDDEAREWLEANLANSRAARRSLGSLGERLETPTLNRSVDRLFALPSDFSNSIAQAITAIECLRDDLLTIRDEESDEVAGAHYGEYVPMVLEHIDNAERFTKSALESCDRLIPVN
ncbi:hypothetical protein GCM10011521_04180 [Arenimonas soli]|uniref:DUF4142 domain-containing protein n=1 Tax=Arenimonas soli TaxID=2269504 RepID=A0ABQ1HCA9_9GAMM|nr:hypothetical protein [Arenimonas soli]GGA69165.1 hypothetical protein GCM10011521_04180 [Arenimonas soli]